MKLIVTHRSPDLDAIGSVWVLKRFAGENFADAKVVFVNAGEKLDIRDIADLGFSMEQTVHVDTGLGEFDHHQEDRGKQRICATSLVYDYVSALSPDLKNDEALKYLVEYTTQIDHFEDCYWENAAGLDKQLLIHNLIDGAKGLSYADDDATLHFGMQCLDAAHHSLTEQISAIKDLKEHKIEFETRWGKAVAVESGHDEVLNVSQKNGYVIAVRKDPVRGGVRIKAIPDKGIDLTPVYQKIMEQDEVGHWFFHASKTMILNGSTKSESTPSPLNLNQVIEMIKQS